MNVHALPTAAAAPTDLISETQVLARRPMLSPGLLKAARKAGTITYTTGKRGTHWYRLADVDAFLVTRETKCRAPNPTPSSSSTDNGSPASPAGTTSTTSPLTQDLAEPLADLLARQI